MRGIHPSLSQTQIAAAPFAINNTGRSIILLLLLYLAATLPENAQDDGTYDSLNDRYRFHVGGFFPSSSSKIEIHGQNVTPPPIEVEDVLGVDDDNADISWQPWQNFGMGVGLRYFNANVKSKGSELNGEFDLEYFGPAVYISASF